MTALNREPLATMPLLQRMSKQRRRQIEHTLLIANLGPNCTEEELKQVLSQYQGFNSLKVRARGGMPVAFADFEICKVKNEEAMKTLMYEHKRFVLHILSCETKVAASIQPNHVSYTLSDHAIGYQIHLLSPLVITEKYMLLLLYTRQKSLTDKNDSLIYREICADFMQFCSFIPYITFTNPSFTPHPCCPFRLLSASQFTAQAPQNPGHRVPNSPSPPPENDELRHHTDVIIPLRHASQPRVHLTRQGTPQGRPQRREIFQLHSFNLPKSFCEAVARVKTHIGYFRMNYAIVHPISLIVFITMMAVWLSLYFLHDELLVIFGHWITDCVVLIVLAVVTIVVLLLMHAATNILVSLLAGGLLRSSGGPSSS
ncbi:Prenylated rab acceptor 1 [Handroanthus impetiginosus]|uniref:Prenylated rab acceptor 1 n=1 Tax=Handroanthus impetiginosus TaxID=429701 RepID=A0A2G9HQV7_9LAMI|nr:Prenylated rab acceptor 1 [Handroanthus impetiginosus]